MDNFKQPLLDPTHYENSLSMFLRGEMVSPTGNSPMIQRSNNLVNVLTQVNDYYDKFFENLNILNKEPSEIICRDDYGNIIPDGNKWLDYIGKFINCDRHQSIYMLQSGNLTDPTINITVDDSGNVMDEVSINGSQKSIFDLHNILNEDPFVQYIYDVYVKCYKRSNLEIECKKLIYNLLIDSKYAQGEELLISNNPYLINNLKVAFQSTFIPPSLTNKLPDMTNSNNLSVITLDDISYYMYLKHTRMKSNYDGTRENLENIYKINNISGIYYYPNSANTLSVRVEWTKDQVTYLNEILLTSKFYTYLKNFWSLFFNEKLIIKSMGISYSVLIKQLYKARWCGDSYGNNLAYWYGSFGGSIWSSPSDIGITKILNYTLSENAKYYIIGVGTTSIEEIESSASTGTAGSGLTDTWTGKDLNIPSKYNGKSIRAIAPKAFYNVQYIQNIYISDGITHIGDNSFERAGLYINNTYIRLPNTLIYIGKEAFKDNNYLREIEIPSTVTTIKESAFEHCDLRKIEIPAKITYIGSKAFLFNNALENISVHSSNTVYDSRDNCNAIIETSTNKLIQASKNTIIPSSVTSIGDYAFGYLSTYSDLEIPSSVTSIGNYAFNGCSKLTTIELGANQVCTLSSTDSIPASSTQHITIKVPADLIESYQAAENWSTLFDNGYITFEAIDQLEPIQS